MKDDVISCPMLLAAAMPEAEDCSRSNVGNKFVRMKESTPAAFLRDHVGLSASAS